jgi:hypothetical protein
MYLIDIVALSELRKRQRHPRLVEWLCAKAAPVEDPFAGPA